MAEWLGGGLQNLLQRFESARNLKVRKRIRKGISNPFFVYTGIRYDDTKKLKARDILEDDTGKYLSVVLEKTEKRIYVPLISKALALIPGDLFPDQNVFKVFSDQPTNRYLKEIAAKASINKNITFHVSRHTFAILSGVYGIPVEIVRDLLGHADIATTLMYRKTTKKQLWSAMDKWEQNDKEEGL